MALGSAPRLPAPPGLDAARGRRTLSLPPRRYIVFAVISLALLMSSIDSTIVAVALESIRRDLHTNVIWEGWTITGYQLGQLLVMPIAGKLSDEWGRKRVFLAAVLIFTSASLLCGVAPNVYFLVAFRIMQAVGGGAFIPSCTGVVSDLFPESRAKAVGLFTSIFPIGGILGPNIGGVLVDQFSWRFVFWVNVPIGIFVIVFTALLYHDRAPAARRHIDFTGATIYGAAVVLLLFALTWLGENRRSVHNPLLWLALGAVPVLLVAFFRWESRAADPVIAPVLLKHRPFLAANLYNFFFGMGVFGVTAFIPTYFEKRYGLTATGAGALLTPRAVAMIIMSTVAALYIIRLGYRLPMIVGVSIQALTLLLLSRGFHHVSLLGLTIGNLTWLGACMALTGFGLGVSQPAANNAAIDLLPGKIAAVTGIRSTFRITGGLIGTALIPLVLTQFGSDEASGLEHIFLAFAALNLLCISLTFFIPDRARARRQRDQPPAGHGEAATPLREAVPAE